MNDALALGVYVVGVFVAGEVREKKDGSGRYGHASISIGNDVVRVSLNRRGMEQLERRQSDGSLVLGTDVMLRTQPYALDKGLVYTNGEFM